MVANGGNTEGLFRGAFMHSGAVIPRGDISLGQQDYDDLVRATGCAGAVDTLECLRQVPFPLLKEAVNKSPELFSYRVRHDFLVPLRPIANYMLQSLNLSWAPRADGTFLNTTLQHLVLQGSVANIPFVTGNEKAKYYVPCRPANLANSGTCDDEGTFFSLTSLNVT